MKIITNNPLVKTELGKREDVEILYMDITYREILTYVRDMVHQGYILLTHPLSGSVKPNENRYRSIGLSDRPGKSLDFKSLEIIESAIVTFDKFKPKNMVVADRIINDMQFIDYTLISSVF